MPGDAINSCPASEVGTAGCSAELGGADAISVAGNASAANASVKRANQYRNKAHPKMKSANCGAAARPKHNRIALRANPTRVPILAPGAPRAIVNPGEDQE